MLKIEEEELGFIPDNDEMLEDFQPDFDNSDSGTDSDADDGELGGQARKDLFSDIIGTINAFSEQYGGKTAYNVQPPKPKKKKEKELLLDMGVSYKSKKKKESVKEAPVNEVREKKKEKKVFVIPPKDKERQVLNKTTGLIQKNSE